MFSKRRWRREACGHRADFLSRIGTARWERTRAAETSAVDPASGIFGLQCRITTGPPDRGKTQRNPYITYQNAARNQGFSSKGTPISRHKRPRLPRPRPSGRVHFDVAACPGLEPVNHFGRRRATRVLQADLAYRLLPRGYERTDDRGRPADRQPARRRPGPEPGCEHRRLKLQPVLVVHHNGPGAILHFKFENGETLLASIYHRFWHQAGLGDGPRSGAR